MIQASHTLSPVASTVSVAKQMGSLPIQIALEMVLGAAGEALGFDKHLKASTTKRRTHSLFRQGCLHYQFIPTMQEARLRPLMEKFGQLMLEQPLFAEIYGVI
jgi:hypothetical protein